jgi:hypothetical protein
VTNRSITILNTFSEFLKTLFMARSLFALNLNYTHMSLDSLNHIVQTGSEVNPTSHPMSAGGSIPGKAMKLTTDLL